MRILTYFLAYSLESGQVGKPLDSGLLLGQHKTWTGAGKRLGSFISGKRKPRGGVPPGWIFAVDVGTGETRSRNACKKESGS